MNQLAAAHRHHPATYEKEQAIWTWLEVSQAEARTYSSAPAGAWSLRSQRWERLTLRVPLITDEKTLNWRIDAGDQLAMIDVAAVSIRSGETKEILWRRKTAADLSDCRAVGTSAALPHSRLLRIVSVGNNVHIGVPLPVQLVRDAPLFFEAWVRIDFSREKLAHCLGHLGCDHSRLENDLQKLKQEQARLHREVRAASRSLEAAHTQNENNRAELIAVRAKLGCVEREMWENKVRRADLTARLLERDQWISEIRKSPLWRMLKPLWKLQRHMPSRRKESGAQRRAGQVVFAVDALDTASTSSKVITMSGWCFSQGGSEVVGIRAKVDGRSYLATYGLQRDEIECFTPEYPGALHSGFCVTFPRPDTGASVFLEAIAQGGSWQSFFKYSFASDIPALTHQMSLLSAPPQTNVRKEEEVAVYPSIRADEVPSLLEPLIAQHRRQILTAAPSLSIITAAAGLAARHMAEAATGLLKQTYPDWEWCLIIPPSTEPAVEHMLERLTGMHGRIRLMRARTSSASEALNCGLDAVKSETVCFLPAQDVLHREALGAIAAALDDRFDVVYCDQDKFDEEIGQRLESFFKPDWSPEYFRSTMYVGPFFAMRRQLAGDVRFRPEYDGVHEFEFMLRASERGARIGHVAQVLYHSRKTAGQIRTATKSASRTTLLQQEAVNAQLRRFDLHGRAETTLMPHRLRIVPEQHASYPRVSVIIPTKDSPELLSPCLKSLYRHTSYPNFETILIDNDTGNPQALAIMRAHPVTRLYLPNPFNFSRANNLAANHATGEYLVFLNNDTEIIAARWLEQLLFYAEQSDVGAVGALLLHHNGAVQHAGVVLGVRGTADHAMRGFSAKADGYVGSLSCAREVSAVTAACMMVRKSLFQEVGKFNEHFFTIYQDLDLCLRLRQRGLRIIWTPQASLLHHESISRQKYYDTVDRYLLLDCWQDVIERGDPYYNANLNLERADYSYR